MSYLACNTESSRPNSAPMDSATDHSPEKFRLLEWILESTPKIPASDAVSLPGLSLFDSADRSDRVTVKRDSLEHYAYYKAYESSLRFNLSNGTGSGFFISGDGLVITASHVVPKGQATVNVNTVDGTKYSAELVARDVNNDLALLKISTTDKSTKFPFLNLNTKDAYGEKLAATGHPKGWPSVYISMGLGFAKPFKSSKWAKADELLGLYAHVEGGNSGGAVIDGCGSVRGVTVGGGVGLIGAAIPSKSIDKLIRWTYDRAPAAGINKEGGYSLAESELPPGSKNKVDTDKANDLPRPVEQESPPELLKKQGPGTFTSPYGKIYKNRTNFYELK